MAGFQLHAVPVQPLAHSPTHKLRGSAAPAATFVQVPRLPTLPHVLHAVSQAALQQ